MKESNNIEAEKVNQKQIKRLQADKTKQKVSMKKLKLGYYAEE
jgi:hypothetical protein